MLLLACVSCNKESTTETNYFANTCWESLNPAALSLTFDFISDTECKVSTKVPIFPATINYYNYTVNGFNATLITKNSSIVAWNCVINGNLFTVEGRSEVFSRVR